MTAMQIELEKIKPALIRAGMNMGYGLRQLQELAGQVMEELLEDDYKDPVDIGELIRTMESAGLRCKDICDKIGISRATFYRRKLGGS